MSPGSPVNHQPNEHMTATAPAPASEDKGDVISVPALLAHTHSLTQTHMHQVNRAPKAERNTEWRRVIQSRAWHADETPTPD